MKQEIKIILNELYALDPSFEKQEKKLVRLIEQMMTQQKEIKIDEQFVKSLRSELLTKAGEGASQKVRPKFFAWNPGWVVATVLLVVLIGSYGFYLTRDNLPGATDRLVLVNDFEVENSGARAFGSLASAVGANNQTLDASVTQEVTGKGAGGGGGLNVSTERAILPMPEIKQYTYQYDGPAIELSDQKVVVFQRQKESDLANKFGSIFNNIKLGLIDLGQAKKLKTNNITLMEDTDFGMIFNFNLQDGSVNINQNWQQWNQHDPVFVCQSLECQENTRLTEKDSLSESELINIANNFLKKYEINTDHLSEPIVLNNNPVFYAEESGKKFIPENMQLIYPLLVDGKQVYDEAGNPFGLNVNVNQRHKRVSGVYNLKEMKYLASEYEAVTDFGQVKQYISANNQNGFIYTERDIKQQVLNLEEPEEILMIYYKYDQGANEEYLVPALKFDIENKPDNSWKQSVVVPLVEEILTERLQQFDDRPVPMPRPVLEEPLIIEDESIEAIKTKSEIDR